MGTLDSIPENVECRMSIGSFIGTGAYLEVPCGFQPYRVELMNLDTESYSVWPKGGPLGASIGRDATGMVFFDLVEGVTPLPSVNGFGLGAMPNINVLGNRVLWIAWG